MPVTPCERCGYDRPRAECSTCLPGPRAKFLGSPPRHAGETLATGLRALPMGFKILLATRGAARLLIPPILLTGMAFGMLFAWLWEQLGELAGALRQGDSSGMLGWPQWARDGVDWWFSSGLFGWLAGAGQFLLFLLLSLAIGWLFFSLVYELISGPFLDELHGRIEAECFGLDAGQSTVRPSDISSGRCWLLSLGWLLASGLCVLLAARLPEASRWLVLGLAALPPLAAAALERRYGSWLLWTLKRESHTLWVSARAALLSGCLLLGFLWLHLIPVVGTPLFFALTGFVTAFSLLDIPFSRRRWSLAQELSFVRRHLLPLSLFGSSAALLFLIPVLGPLTMVPTASVGGLWLLCRLDKSGLGPESARQRPPTKMDPGP